MAGRLRFYSGVPQQSDQTKSKNWSVHIGGVVPPN
jgi:hypothetical protein